MAWIELHITTTAEYADAFSFQLNECGAKAVTFKDASDDHPIYEPTPNTPRIWPTTIVVGLFEKDHQPLDSLIAHLEKQQEITSLHIVTLEDEDWVRRSLDQFKPLCFGKRLWIYPSWHKPPDSNTINVMLDPGLAFGTGTHPTTALCLEWLDQHITNQSLAIDYGCGSGILGIAAYRLGVKKIIAVDNDPQALTAAIHNAEQNGIPASAFTTQLTDISLSEPAPLVMANILAQPLISLAPLLSDQTLVNGSIVLSGILTHQIDEVLQAYTPWFDMQLPVFKEEWVRLAGVKR